MKKYRIFSLVALSLTSLKVLAYNTSSQVAASLSSSKSEINDAVDYGVVILWLIFLGKAAQFIWGRNEYVKAFAIGILAPGILTTMIYAHKFVV